MTAVKVEAVKVEAVTATSLVDARDKYRSGRITLGEFFALLDRFLDGMKPTATPVKEKTNEPS